MATISRVKTWSASETLTAANLNAEFNNILTGTNSGALDATNLDATDTYTFAELIVGAGISAADGNQLHVHTASAGAVSASADGDEVVAENSGNAGLSILSGNADTGNLFFGDDGDNDIGGVSYNHSTNTLSLTAGTTAVYAITSSGSAITGTLSVSGATTQTGALIVDDTTDATSATTGSIQTDGGLGIVKALWVGTTSRLVGAVTADAVVSLDDTTDTSSTTTGSLHTDGGVGIAKALWVGTTSRLVGAVTMDAVLSVDDTTESTSGTTGSIHTDGGLGVAKDIYLGDDLLIATGAVFNWAAGDVTLTHSAAKLTFGGDGAVEIDFNNHEMTNVDINSGAIDGTTVGSASAAAGAFTTLAASGNVTLSAGSGGILDLGTTGYRIDFDTDGDTSIRASADDILTFETGAADNFAMSNKILFVGATANAKMTQGITIHGGTSNNEHLALKNSSVTQPVTDEAEPDTFGVLQKAASAAGGLRVWGLRDSGSSPNRALDLMGMLGEAADTTDTSSSHGVIRVDGRVTNDGTATAAVAAAGNIFTIESENISYLLVKGDGTLHATNVTAGSGDLDGVALDEESDANLIRAHQRSTSNGLGMIMSKWDEQVKENDEDLKRVGVLSSDGHFYNVQRMVALQGGAIWQNHVQVQELAEALDATRHELAETKDELKRLAA